MASLYIALKQGLRSAFNREAKTTRKDCLLLTVAIPVGKSYIDNGYDVEALSR